MQKVFFDNPTDSLVSTGCRSTSTCRYRDTVRSGSSPRTVGTARRIVVWSTRTSTDGSASPVSLTPAFYRAIRASLGIELDLFDLQREPRLAERLRSSFPREPPSFTRLVVEGELVPYEEASGTIEEFWKLGAAKVGLNELPLQELASQADSYETGATISPRRKQCRPADAPTLHLKVVWFDILMIDDEALLLCEWMGPFCAPRRTLTHRFAAPYQERRARLASLVTEIQGYVHDALSGLARYLYLIFLRAAEYARRVHHDQLPMRRRPSSTSLSLCAHHRHASR